MGGFQFHNYNILSLLSNNFQNQRVVGQNLEQGNNGFAHPTMANSPEFPNYHQEQVIPIPFMYEVNLLVTIFIIIEIS